MNWTHALTVSKSEPIKPKPPRRKRASYRTKPNVIEQIRADIQKRDELRAELAKYTLEAIAIRVGLHPRTVEKLLAK